MLTARWLLLGNALLLFASVAFGEGDYQRTKDGKTTVWNSDPKPGDEATWSGGRDREGYASGFGTLTWYTGQKQAVRHLGIPFTKSDVYARYFGNMVRGKFNGSVNIHSQGKTGHAVFADGVRTTRWAAGPAPYRAGAEQLAAVAKQTPAPKLETPAAAEPPAKRDAAKTEKPEPHIEPSTPAAGPSAAPRTDNAVAKAESAKLSEPDGHLTPNSENVREQEAQRPIEDTAVERRREVKEQRSDQAADAAKRDADNSLRLLAGPPSSLHMKPVSEGPPAGANPDAAPSSYTNARLTKEEVVDIADAEARSRGYDLAEYQRMDPQYYPTDEIWTLGYDGTMEIGKHFSVTIDDKTKGRVFVPGK